MNIVFIGYRCTGKTTVGKMLAQSLGCKFCDTDNLIVELKKMSIKQIVDEGGWDAFREMERAVIGSISLKNNYIISPGGGAVIDQTNVNNLRINGKFVWLKADAQTIADRLTKDISFGDRCPSLSGRPVVEEIEEILKERNLIYESIRDYEIDTDNLTVDQVLEEVRKVVQIITEKQVNE